MVACIFAIMPFNHHHRQFLQKLRDRDWVHVSKLPDQKAVKLDLLTNGWIEQQGLGKDRAYRITPAGLDEMKRPVKLYKQREGRPPSKYSANG